jgi:dolichyl-phosphate beta-glucosyltransferase
MNYPALSIVIPAYNEQDRILPTLTGVLSYIKKKDISAEVIVVDDGSTDGTSAVIENLAKTEPSLSLIRLKRNRGKGFAVKTGILHSEGDLILFMDADESTPVTELPKLLPYVQKYDIVIGSRISISATNSPLYRKIISRLGRSIISGLLSLPITDTQCGFKILKAKPAQLLAQQLKIERFGFDVELLARAIRQHYHIKEVPVLWNHRNKSSVRPIVDSVKTFLEILRIWYFVYSDQTTTTRT